MLSRFAVAASLSLVLAACGSPAEESDEPEAMATPEASETAAAPEAAASETPAAEASATPGPSPTPSASASPKPAASPSVAAAGPPESFKQCAVCHSTERGQTLIGPSLAGIFGTRAGDVAGFKFSPAMMASGLTWNAATLDTYLTDPKKLVPGTTMSFGGVKDGAKRAEIIAYLKTL